MCIIGHACGTDASDLEALKEMFNTEAKAVRVCQPVQPVHTLGMQIMHTTYL